jgi:hypothetical protein
MYGLLRNAIRSSLSEPSAQRFSLVAACNDDGQGRIVGSDLADQNVTFPVGEAHVDDRSRNVALDQLELAHRLGCRTGRFHFEPEFLQLFDCGQPDQRFILDQKNSCRPGPSIEDAPEFGSKRA